MSVIFSLCLVLFFLVRFESSSLFFCFWWLESFRDASMMVLGFRVTEFLYPYKRNGKRWFPLLLTAGLVISSLWNRVSGDMIFNIYGVRRLVLVQGPFRHNFVGKFLKHVERFTIVRSQDFGHPCRGEFWLWPLFKRAPRFAMRLAWGSLSPGCWPFLPTVPWRAFFFKVRFGG